MKFWSIVFNVRYILLQNDPALRLKLLKLCAVIPTLFLIFLPSTNGLLQMPFRQLPCCCQTQVKTELSSQSTARVSSGPRRSRVLLLTSMYILPSGGVWHCLWRRVPNENFDADARGCVCKDTSKKPFPNKVSQSCTWVSAVWVHVRYIFLSIFLACTCVRKEGRVLTQAYQALVFFKVSNI